jgi:RimJ/RimL family protein N-acetyltransferase
MVLGPAPILDTPRLRLRPLVSADAMAVLAYAGEPGFFRYIGHVPEQVRHHYRLEDAKAHIAELYALAARGYPHWGIVPRGSQHPVGAIRFRPYDGTPTPELGYGVASAWRGRGLVTEAGRAVLGWAVPRAPSILARCHPENRPSIHVLQKLGFQEAGRDPGGQVVFRLGARPGAKP